MSGLTEVGIFLAFCTFISALQMRIRTKITISLLLAFRLGYVRCISERCSK